MITATETTQTISESKTLFDEIIEDWENRKIVETLTREEREKEYQIALEKLQDFIEEEALKEDYDTMQSIRRARIEMSLRDRVLTKEEQREKEKQFL
jgi:hypothetical protein